MDSSEFNRDYYTSFFQTPEKYYGPQRGKIKRILKLFEKHTNDRILDIGCGDGYISSLIAEKTGARLYGIDISSSAVKKAKERGVVARIKDINKGLPYPRSYFNAVFCGDIIEHVFDTEKLIGEVYRVLKPEGYLIATVPNLAAWYNRFFLLIGWLPMWIESGSSKPLGNPFAKMAYGHIRAFTKKSIIELLRNKRFRIEKMLGSPVFGPGIFNPHLEKIWNKIDTLFSNSSSLASVIIVKARKL